MYFFWKTTAWKVTNMVFYIVMKDSWNLGWIKLVKFHLTSRLTLCKRWIGHGTISSEKLVFFLRIIVLFERVYVIFLTSKYGLVTYFIGNFTYCWPLYMYSLPQKYDQCCTVTQVESWHWFYLGFHDLTFYFFNMTVNIFILFL